MTRQRDFSITLPVMYLLHGKHLPDLIRTLAAEPDKSRRQAVLGQRVPPLLAPGDLALGEEARLNQVGQSAGQHRGADALLAAGEQLAEGASIMQDDVSQN